MKKFEKREGAKYLQFVIGLGEMAVAGEGDDVLAYTSEWLTLVNRGGLFSLNDNTFTFFGNRDKCKAVSTKTYACHRNR